jgi:hypothetical protein
VKLVIWYPRSGSQRLLQTSREQPVLLPVARRPITFGVGSNANAAASYLAISALMIALVASSHAPSARRLHLLASSNSKSASCDAAIPLHIPSRAVLYTNRYSL